MLSKNRKWYHDLKIAYGVKGLLLWTMIMLGVSEKENLKWTSIQRQNVFLNRFHCILIFLNMLNTDSPLLLE